MITNMNKNLKETAKEPPRPLCTDIQEGFDKEIYRKLPRGLQGQVALIFHMDLIPTSAGNCSGASKAILH